MNLLAALQEKYPEAARSMTAEQKATALRIEQRLQAIDENVKEYRESRDHHAEPLYSSLRRTDSRMTRSGSTRLTSVVRLVRMSRSGSDATDWELVAADTVAIRQRGLASSRFRPGSPV